MRHHKLKINDDSNPNFFLTYINPISPSFFIKSIFFKFSLLKKILTFALRVCSICLVLSEQANGKSFFGIVGSKLRIEIILEFWSEESLKCILFTKWNSEIWIEWLFRLIQILVLKIILQKWCSFIRAYIINNKIVHQNLKPFHCNNGWKAQVLKALFNIAFVNFW